MNLYTADAQTLASFFEVAGAGVVVFDVHADHARLLCANSAFIAMYDPDGGQQPDTGLALPPDILQTFDAHARQCASQLTPIEFEHPLEVMAMSQWQRVHMIPVSPKQGGDFVRIFAIAVDITDRRYREYELHITYARLKSIFDSSYEGIITFGTDQRIRTLNQAAAHIFGYAPDELVGQPLEILIPEHLRDRHQEHAHQFHLSPELRRAMANRIGISGLRKDGSEFMAEIAIAKIEVGGAMEFTAYVRDVSEQLRLMEELHLKAYTDPLTGLNNRWHMTEEAEKELVRAQRFSHPTTVMLIDLDDFKSINDRYGHHVGDQVLREAANICRRRSRQTDIIARWGGEEFLILLPETDIDGTLHLANRILKELNGLHAGVPRLGIHQITASIGVAMQHGGEDSFDTMVYRADQAMYIAKNSGKNRVVPAD
ncbi:MAG TPA: sensor domain-containing diguanylate cyclase [Mariprofundaceae bacterium]|nr:sensor domain-containing diguanylate cyclase [Mariprofundaceae bacterium]